MREAQGILWAVGDGVQFSQSAAVMLVRLTTICPEPSLENHQSELIFGYDDALVLQSPICFQDQS